MTNENVFPRLVADLGGTNIRFAICDGVDNTDNSKVALREIEQFSLRDYEDLKHLITHYLANKNLNDDTQKIKSCCFAVAGAIFDNKVKMTNYDWEISTDLLKDILNIQHAWLINDFAAIAHSVPYLDDSQLISIGEGKANPGAPISLFGPGTGLGAALLIPLSSNTEKPSYKVVATEGGHAAISARSSLELSIFDYWRAKGSRINREFFVCGAGIERLYEAIVAINNNGAPLDDAKSLTAPQIQQRGCGDGTTAKDDYCRQAMHAFCTLLGSAAGDQALCTGAQGGLILAGGILPKFVEFLSASNFRHRFESKGVMSDYNKAISTHLIIEPQPGLIGAAAYSPE
jgi:glucokinase